MTKINFLSENRAYADSMTGSSLTDEELFNVIQKETGYDNSECDWLVELIREMEVDEEDDND